MIITGGRYKGKKLKTVRGDTVRCSSALLKESLFNILHEAIIDSVFLDLFAGSGSVGIEALSRGAKKVIFVEENKLNARLINNNLQLLKPEAETLVINRSAEKTISGLVPAEADLIFLDPPYELIEKEYICKIFELIVNFNILAEDGLIILEYPVGQDANTFTIVSLELFKNKKYGKSSLGFWKLKT